MTVAIGQIVVWQGISIPENWQVCDGSDGTPDLRGMFVYGKYDDSDTPTSASATTHTHVGAGSSTNASHDHSATSSIGTDSGTSTLGGANRYAAGDHNHGSSATIVSAVGHSHSTSLASSSGLPPYMLLYYIMKVA